MNATFTKWMRHRMKCASYFVGQHQDMHGQTTVLAAQSTSLSRYVRIIALTLTIALLSNLCFRVAAVPTVQAEESSSSPQYIFRLNGFSISNTMSRHEDTDYVYFTIKVGNTMYPVTRGEKKGDLNNGDYTLNWDFGPLQVNPDDPIIVTYSIINHGNGGEDEIIQTTNKIQEAVAGILIPLTGGTVGTVVGVVSSALDKVADLLGFVFADCDGTVLSGAMSNSDSDTDGQMLNGQMVNDLTSGTGSYTRTFSHEGTPKTGCRTAHYTVTWSIIRVSPVVACAPVDDTWHDSDVNVTCQVSSSGGRALEPDRALTLSTQVPDNIETNNAIIASPPICDIAEKCVAVRPIGPVKVDKKPPTLIIHMDQNIVYTLNQHVLADYTCADGGSGLASCMGTVATGGAVDTFSLGQKVLTVSAVDRVGHTTAQSIYYTVVYPIPVLDDLSPTSIPVGSPSVTITATGSGFVPISVLAWNGISLQTTFIDEQHLKATLPAAYLIRSSTAEVHVITPAPGGGISESRPFVITSTTPAARLEFFRQPNDGIVGTVLTPTLTVRALDASGSVATSFNGPVSVALRQGSGSAGAQLGGTTTVNAVNGVATFNDVTVDRPGENYVLVAHSMNLSQPDSKPFRVQVASDYVVMALRTPLAQNTTSQFAATLTLENHTSAALPAGTRIRWLLQGVHFDPNNRNANILTGAALTNLSLPQLNAHLDSPLASGAQMTMTLQIALTQPIDPAQLAIKAFIEGGVGRQPRQFSSNMITSTTSDGVTQPLRVTASGGTTAGSQTRVTFKGAFFANHEPVVITTTLPDSFQSLPSQTSDTGVVTLMTYQGLAPGHYAVRVLGVWSGVSGQTDFDLGATNTSTFMSKMAFERSYEEAETPVYTLFLPIAHR